MTGVKNEYEYLGVGTPVRASYPEPKVKWDLSPIANDFDGLDALDRVIDNRWINTQDDSDVDRVKYGYDRLSNRTSRRNPVAETANDELYRYDNVQRLVDLARGTLADEDTRIENPTAAERWNLDATGNWGRYQSLDFATPENQLDQTRATNAANELTAFQSYYGPNWAEPAYDRAGNMTSFPQPSSPTDGCTAVFDAWNRMVKVLDGETPVRQNAYDGLFRRTTQTADSVVRHYFYSKQWQVLEERLDSSSDPNRQFLWGLRYIDELILRDRDPNGSSGLIERLYALNDANWNVTSIVDKLGEVQERYRYSAYGTPAFLDAEFAPLDPNESAFEWETLYSGYQYSVLTFLYQLRSRILHPAIGCFVSRDPSKPYDADASLYAYARLNPKLFIDPSGLDWQPVGRMTLKLGNHGGYSDTIWRSSAVIRWIPPNGWEGNKNCPCKKVRLFQVAVTNAGNIIFSAEWHHDPVDVPAEGGAELTDFEVTEVPMLDSDPDPKNGIIGRSSSIAKLLDDPGRTGPLLFGNLSQMFETCAACVDPQSQQYKHIFGCVQWSHYIIKTNDILGPAYKYLEITSPVKRKTKLWSGSINETGVEMKDTRGGAPTDTFKTLMESIIK